MRKLSKKGSSATLISLQGLLMRECQEGSCLWRKGCAMIHPKTKSQAAELMNVKGEKVSTSGCILEINDQVTIRDRGMFLSLFRQSTPYP
jgi:hypothetical protein